MLKLLHSPHLLTVHVLVVVAGLLTYVLTTHSLQQRRAPTAALSWALSIALLPYIGLPLYLLFGTRKLVHAANRGGELPVTSGEGTGAWLNLLTASLGPPPAAASRRISAGGPSTNPIEFRWRSPPSRWRSTGVARSQTSLRTETR